MKASIRGALLSAVALLTLGLAPGAARATTYYARGGGGNGKASCALGDECNLQKAVNEATAAGAGSAVVLMPGPAFTPSDSIFLAGIDVGGEAGAPRPTVIAPEGEEAFGVGVAADLHDVEVVGESGNAVVAVVGGTVERAFVEATSPGGGACVLFDSVVADSVCFSRKGSGIRMSGSTATYHAHLYNVDAIGEIFGIEVSAPLEAGRENRLEATNTIAAGSKYQDVKVDGSVGGAQALFTNSDYATTEITGASANLTITPAGTNGGVAVAPQFVAPEAGDFHQLPTSPTVDAGFAEPANGDLDLDRNPRALSAHPTCDSSAGPPDIGAYEYVAPLPTCAPPGGGGGGGDGDGEKSAPPPPPVPSAPDTTLRKAKIDAGKGTATFTFAGSGAVSGFACEVVRPAPIGAKASGRAKRRQPKFAACKSPKTYKHLVPGAYAFKVEATGAGGADPTPALRKFRIRP